MSPADQAAVDAARAELDTEWPDPPGPPAHVIAVAAAVGDAAVTLELYAAAGRPTSRVRCALELLTGVLRDATREGT